MTQDDDRGRLGRLVFVHEHAPHQRGNAGHFEGRGTNLGGFDRFAGLLANGQVPLHQPEGADVFDGSKSLPPGDDVVRTRRSSIGLRPVPVVQRDDAISAR